MAITAFKSWSSGEILTAADLNSSFSQIINNPIDLWSPSTKAMDLGGFALTNGGSAAFTTLSTSGLATLASATVTATATAAAFVPSGAGVPTNGLYLKAANNPALSSNTTLRWDVSSAGNHTFAAPSSGTTFTVSGVAGARALQINSAVANNAVVSLSAVGTRDYHLIANSSGQFVIRDDTGTTDRIIIGSAGNVTIAAPSAGGPLSLAMNATASTIGVSVSPATLTLQYPLSAQSSGANSFAIEQSADNSYRIGMTTAHSFALMTSNATRFSAASGGAMTMTATSGVLLTGTGVAGSDALVMNGGTSGSFRVNTTGVPYGTSLHNNAGAVTGTTNQYVCSGTYSPTLFNTTNIAASTTGVCSWMRVGNVVTVAGQISIDPTAATTSSLIGISLPIASNLAAGGDCCGLAIRNGDLTAQQIVGALFADTANDRASVAFFCDADAANRVWEIHFTYVML